MRDTCTPGRAARLVAVLLAALVSCVAAPIPIAAQPAAQPAAGPQRPAVVLEQYLSRATLDPTVVGTRARVTGIGARLLHPLAPWGSERWAGLASRLSVGGFLTHVPPRDGIAASHYGLAADFRLRAAPLAGRVEPIAALGVGPFRTRRDDTGRPAVSCIRPLDLSPAVAAPACIDRPRATRAAGVYPAVSPALALRIPLLRGVALRTEARDVMVSQHGHLRHNFELATGVSLVR